MTDKRNLNILSPINTLSYGLVGMNFVYELWKSQEYNISLFPLNENSIQASPKFHDCLRETINNRHNFDKNADCLRIWHQFEMSNFVGKGRHIGYSIWEMNQLTKLEQHHLKSLDLLIVPTEWQKSICNKYDIHSEVVPLGYDSQIFNKSPMGLKQDKFVFLNIGKWEIRKGHDVLVDAFNDAFGEADNVELWMCCENVHSSPEENKEWADLYLNSKLGSKIRIIPRQETQEQLSYIIKKASCGIYPARAEGWNLDLLETMSSGVACITTNYSGHTAFCNDDNSLLIHPDRMEQAYDGKWFVPNGVVNQGEWLNFDTKMYEQTTYLMKWAYNNPKQLSIIADKAFETTRGLTWKHASEKLVSVLSKIITTKPEN